MADEPFTAQLGDRSLFPTLEARAYLNHAAISPPSLPVLAAVEVLMRDYARLGVGAVPVYGEQRTRLRSKLARLVGAPSESIALATNTSRAVSDIALCLPWRRGDRIVLFEGEFPANVTPWQRAAELFELEVSFLPASEYLSDTNAALSRLDHELGRGARLVAASAVQFQSGLAMPIAEMGALCERHGAELFVDAIQACGAVPLDVAHVDYLACGGQKWLMGLEGAGFLYVDPRRVGSLRPHVAGWLSHENALEFLFEGPGKLVYDRPLKRDTGLFEGGSPNAVGLVALEASLDLIQQLGVPAIYQHVGSYLDALEAGLLERGFSSLRAPDRGRRSCILGVLPPAGVTVMELRRALVARQVACTIPDGVLRFAPHWPNALAEVPIVLDAVDAALAERRGPA